MYYVLYVFFLSMESTEISHMNSHKMAEKLPRNGLRNITVTMATQFHSVHSGLVTTALGSGCKLSDQEMY